MKQLFSGTQDAVLMEVPARLKKAQQIRQKPSIHPIINTSWVKESRSKMVAIFKGEIQASEVALPKEIDTLDKKIGQMLFEVPGLEFYSLQKERVLRS